MSDQLMGSMSEADRLELILGQIMEDTSAPDNELVESRLREIYTLDDFIISFFEWIELDEYFRFEDTYKLIRQSKLSCYGIFENHALLLRHLLEKYRMWLLSEAQNEADSNKDLKAHTQRQRSGFKVYRNEAIKEKPKGRIINIQLSLP